jgi:hypothetical protein
VQAYRSDALNDMAALSPVAITKGVANISLPASSAVLAIAH